MNWRPFSYDAATGERTLFAHDPIAKKNYFKIEQDIEPILERNKALANHDDRGWTKTREWRRVAEIPNVVLEMWRTQHGCDVLAKGNEKLLKRLLNDPENRFLRTAPGRV